MFVMIQTSQRKKKTLAYTLHSNANIKKKTT